MNSATRIIFGRMNNAVLRKQIMSYAKSVKEAQTEFWAKNQKLHRPMSPHLTIYRLPLPAILSVTHRATGVALSGLTILFGLGSFYYAGNFESVLETLQTNVHPHVILTFKALIALAFTYKTLTGTRHLVWDTGKGLALPNVYKSGYAAIALAIVSGLALAVAYY